MNIFLIFIAAILIKYLIVGFVLGCVIASDHLFHKKRWLRNEAWILVGTSTFLWGWFIIEIIKDLRNGKTTKTTK